MSAIITGREVKVLEFDRIRQNLASMTVSPMGREEALKLFPAAGYEVVQNLLVETGEGRLLCSKNAFSPLVVTDIEQLIDRAEKGSVLSGTELIEVKAFLKAAQRWQIFFKAEEPRELYPVIYGIVSRIAPVTELSSELKRSIDDDGKVLDSASSQLASLRRQQRSLQEQVRNKLDEYLRNSNTRRYLQENLVTIRSGRYVLPVRQEYRQYIQGVVHDQSASGATVFIEPMPVVQMQNQLTGLKRSEEREIERILYQLTVNVAGQAEELLANRLVYARLDLIVARGRLSYEQKAFAPQLLKNSEPLIELFEARHPLLPGEAVPLNVELGGPLTTLVVTGPNTGGKTVALKTIGLLAVMAQSGLHIPAGKETRLSLFRQIRADIGDEQSIAQSLSTFSGHMKNIIAIATEAQSGSLVLLDELGAGTDPTEGAALAMALLEKLTLSGAITVATTHINELKLYAQAEEKLQNAAMEFDPDSLSPTYRLLQGVPGQSNAFVIASKLGLEDAVLDKAKSFMHRSHDQVESIIASLVEDQQRYSRDSRQASIERSRAELLMADLEREQEMIRARKEDILNQAREEARHLLRRTKTSVDDMIRELRKIKAESGGQSRTRAEGVRRELHQLKDEVLAGEEDRDEGQSPDPSELSKGQIFFIKSLQQNGEIVSFTEEEALLQVGSMRVHVPLSELRPDSGTSKTRGGSSNNETPLPSGGYSVEKETAISSSVDLRGMTIDEAQPIVDKLIDNAVWAGLNRVDVIHGKGTGKLKDGLREYLKSHTFVLTIRAGNGSEGGDGVTVVELKQ